MAFTATWHTLLDTLDELDGDTTLTTPFSGRAFRIADTQEHRVLVSFHDEDGTVPLQREQFETLYRRVTDAADSYADADGFELDRLPPDAEPYATVLSVHPRFELDEREGYLRESDTPTGSPLVDARLDEATDASTGPAGEEGASRGESTDRSEPDVPVYADALLLIDALERHDPTAPAELETAALVNLYTLLSDVQRNADDLRKEVADVLLDRLHHDQPVAAQFGSVQRTTRRRRSLRDEEEVLETLSAAGIDREQVTSVDASKVDDALDVTPLSASDVYEISQTEYVRKAEVDEEEKETRLQGLKDRLANVDEETDQLQREIEELEARIDSLTSFDTGTAFHTASGGDP